MSGFTVETITGADDGYEYSNARTIKRKTPKGAACWYAKTTEISGPVMVVDARIVRDLVRQELGVIASGDAADFVAAVRHTCVHLAVQVGIAS